MTCSSFFTNSCKNDQELKKAGSVHDSPTRFNAHTSIDGRCAAYYQAAVSSAGDTFAAVLVDLLELGCCPRCCLRFAGAQPSANGNVYQQAAPTFEHFAGYVKARITSPGTDTSEARAIARRQAEAVATALISGTETLRTSSTQPQLSDQTFLNPERSSAAVDAQQSDFKSEFEDSASQPTLPELPSAVSGQASPASCVCLGILQAIDQSNGTAPEELLEEVPDLAGSGAMWYRPNSSLGEALVGIIR